MQRVFFTPLILLFVGLSVRGLERNGSTNVTLIVLGRSGMGISSTVRAIVGQNKTIHKPTGSPTPIQELEVPLPGNEGLFLKLVDVDGLVDGKSSEEDALVLSSLKSYLTETDPQNGTSSYFFLFISNFDDSRFRGPHSLFTQTLNRVSEFQNSVYNSTSENTLFLFTRLMSATKLVQRDPTSKIETFRSNIKAFSDFKDPIRIIVGENLPDDFDLKHENGLTLLPNGDYYPQNVLTALIEIANRTGGSEAAKIIQDFSDSRTSLGEVYSRYYRIDGSNGPENDDTGGEVETSTTLTTVNPLDEIGSALQLAYDQLDVETKANLTLGMIELKSHFENNNLTHISQLPRTALDKVKFFHNLPILNSQILRLIESAFGIFMPEALFNPVVGYGFDMTQDSSLETTPFSSQDLKPSPIGYLTPDFLTCDKLTKPREKDFAFCSPTLQDYITLRYKFLGFESTTNLSQMSFEGVVQSGFNLCQGLSDRITTLSAVREVRTTECKLVETPELSEEFRDAVNDLTPLVRWNRESVKIWRGFFREYGTHVVSQVFGGGYIKGSVVDNSEMGILTSEGKVNKTLDEIMDFDSIALANRSTYGFFGGDKDARLEFVSSLDHSVREELLQNWKNSLKYDPMMLQYEMKLIPLADFVKRVDEELGLEVEKAAEVLLSGNLTYIRRPTRPHVPSISSTIPPTVASFSIPSISTTLGSKTNTGIATSTFEPPSHVNPFYPPIDPTKNTYTTYTQSTYPAYFPPTYSTDTPPMYFTFKTPTYPSYEARTYPTPTTAQPTTARPTTIRPTTTRPAIKVKVEQDYTANSVGQGYHMLKDIVLPKSPFSGVQSFSKIIQWEAVPPCKLLRANMFESPFAYIEDRLMNKFNVLHVPEEVVRNFKGRLYPGNVIGDCSKNCSLQVEVRSDRQFIRRLKYSDLDIKFGAELENLPSFHFDDPAPDCKGRQQWKEFFNKFGTHYVQSTYIGYSQNRNVPFERFSAAQHQKKCESCGTKYKWNFSTFSYDEIHLPCEKNPASKIKPTNRLKPSFEFVSYSDMVSWDERLSLSISEAMFHLMKDNLACEKVQ